MSRPRTIIQSGNIRERRESEAGLSIVELGLLLPVVLLTLFGIFEFGRVFWYQHVVNAAAREGARLAVLNEPSDVEVREAVDRRLADGGVLDPHSVDISQRISGQPVVLTVRVDFAYLVIGMFLPGLPPDRITATSVQEHAP